MFSRKLAYKNTDKEALLCIPWEHIGVYFPKTEPIVLELPRLQGM